MISLRSLVSPVVLIVLGCGSDSGPQTIRDAPFPTTHLKVASFSCDVTPPLGHPLCGVHLPEIAS